MHATPTVILENYRYFECPRWHDGRLWVSDFYTHEVISLEADGSDVRVEAVVQQQPSGLGWLPDGRLLVVSMLDKKVLRREESGELVVHADVSEFTTGSLNDMVVDDQGRAYVGNFGFDVMNGEDLKTASLVRVDPDGSARVVATDLYFPNGMVITATGELLVNETVGNRVSAFTIADDGSLGERRDWATFGDLPTSSVFVEALPQLVVAPDGGAGAPDGSLWAADALGNRIVHVREGGGVVDEIAFDTGIFACGFGGDDGRTLFLCAAPDFNEHLRKEAREAKILAIQL